jgi:hypothetical protein
MAHYVYILQSLKDGRYYIGETGDVEARLLFPKMIVLFPRAGIFFELELQLTN